MANANTNSMAAVLSLVVLVIFWLAIIVGIVGFLLVGTGFLGSLNGGVVKLPGMETYVQDVNPGRMFVAIPTAIPLAPLASRLGNRPGISSGSSSSPL